jgi:uncharacterized Tic20 family protein
VAIAKDADQMTREPEQDQATSIAGVSDAVRDADVTWAMLGYLGAIFTGPVIPLVVYLVKRRKSQFMCYHGGRALNLALTVLLYTVCCLILGALLALDTLTLALAVAIPLVVLLWLAMLRYLIRGVGAAQRGEAYEVPDWICGMIVSSG